MHVDILLLILPEKSENHTGKLEMDEQLDWF